MYRSLNPDAIITTCAALGRRIVERFPESGLSRVASELLDVTRETVARIDRLRRPHWPVRVGVGLVLVVLAGSLVGFAQSLRLPGAVEGIGELLQALESAVNDVMFLGIGIFFLVTIESRLKRREALRALHELRSIAHVIDMHQLTKDPDILLTPARETSSSPARHMSRFQLSRYLDYCSELLSITSNVAALYLQHMDDALVLSAVNDIQSLTGTLSGKIWQKIVILDTVAVGSEAPRA